MKVVCRAVSRIACESAEMCGFPRQQDWCVCFWDEEDEHQDDGTGKDGREPVRPLEAHKWACGYEVCYGRSEELCFDISSSLSFISLNMHVQET